MICKCHFTKYKSKMSQKRYLNKQLMYMLTLTMVKDSLRSFVKVKNEEKCDSIIVCIVPEHHAELETCYMMTLSCFVSPEERFELK